MFEKFLDLVQCMIAKGDWHYACETSCMAMSYAIEEDDKYWVRVFLGAVDGILPHLEREPMEEIPAPCWDARHGPETYKEIN